MSLINVESFWINKKNRSYIKKEKISGPIKSEVLIKTIFSGISYGTEQIVYAGKVPKSEKKLMRCPYQVGDFGSDVKYGYLNIGKIIDGETKDIGKNVFTLYPHQNLFTINESEVSLIPRKIPLKRTLLTANMETAINALWDTLPTSGDKCVVIGAGIVGILMAYLLNSIIGVDVVIIDKDKKKKNIANLFDLNFDTSLSKTMRANFIYECSGDSKIINKLGKFTENEATICILSWYGTNQSRINFGEHYLSKRLNIIFSQVSKISKNRIKNWTNKTRRDFAINLLNNKKLDYLIDKNEIKFHKLPNFFKNSKNKNFFCKVVNYNK
tara:strand:+ start:183837 stop:184814 length:978 start_codon:yes stop_codon:yes gene_type:complete